MYEYNFLPGEKKDIQKAIEIAQNWGYGNLIAHLKYEWAMKLVKDGISKEAAIQATNVSAYPLP